MDGDASAQGGKEGLLVVTRAHEAANRANIREAMLLVISGDGSR